MSGAAPVGRFAPTPSGRMHLGNVFAAMIAWLSVRSRGGSLVLRMEDLDTQRTSAEFAETLRSDLLWLGLDWDLETPPQSRRSAVYDRYFEQLRQLDLLYLFAIQIDGKVALAVLFNSLADVAVNTLLIFDKAF